MTALNEIVQPRFEDQFTGIATSDALYFALTQSQDVKNISIQLDSGVLTEEQVEEFLVNLGARFTSGNRFPGELALCAIAVALRMRATPFSARLIEKLSSLQAREIRLARGVAKLAFRARAVWLGGSTTKSYQLSSPVPSAASRIRVRATAVEYRYEA